MEKKFASILRQIPWFSLVKAAVFGAAVYLLPVIGNFIFAAASILIWVFAPPRPGGETGQFLALLAVILFAGNSLPAAVLAGLLFFILLGVKSFYFSESAAALSVFSILLVFLSYLTFFSHYGFWGRPAGLPFVAAILPAWLFFYEFRRLAAAISPEKDSASIRMRSFASAFIMWQLTIVLVFMPLPYPSQTALAIVSAAVISYFGFVNSRSRRLTAAAGGLFLLAAVVILIASNWDYSVSPF